MNVCTKKLAKSIGVKLDQLEILVGYDMGLHLISNRYCNIYYLHAYKKLAKSIGE